MKQGLISALVWFGAVVTMAQNAGAALPPAFHNVALDVAIGSLVDFTAQGLGPQSLTQYNGANGALVAGVFNAQSLGDVAHLGLQMDAFAQVEKDMAIQNRVPRELTIFNVGGSNITLYGGIWTKSPHPTAFVYHLTEDQFSANWQEWVVQKGYRITEHQEWVELGVRFHAAVFVKDGRPFFFNYGQAEADFAKSNADLGAQGFVINKMNITNTPTGDIFSGIWMKTTQAVTFFYDMTSDGYQNEFNQLGPQGFQLKQVLGYGALGGQFGAIWAK